MIEQIILIIHVLLALSIIGLILLQQGKGADMGASFGGGGSQTLFGPTGGGNVLTRATAIFSTLFFVTSFSLAIIAKQKTSELNVDSALTELETAAALQEEAAAVPEEIDDTIPAEIIQGAEVIDAPIDIVDEIP